MRLNLGCGTNKISGCINIDVEKSCNPDLIVDFLNEKLPFDAGSVSTVYLFHTIEHIQKRKHRNLLDEIHRVLKPGGVFFVAFPEFKKCYKNWEVDKGGQKHFWEATMFGRQLYPSDHHVCIMDSIDFRQVLLESGFDSFQVSAEPEPNEFNMVIQCKKAKPYGSYEELVQRETDSIEFVRHSFND